MKIENFIKLKYLPCTAILSFLFLNIQAQNPAPYLPQSKPIVITGATIHVGNGQVIENGILVFDKGLITVVGPAGPAGNISGAEMINAKGKHIYPGLISLNTTVGIQEIASVRATLDYNEVGQVNPHVRALVAFNTDSEVIPTLRGNGVLVSQAVPQGGIVSGSSSMFYMDGWNWEDAVLKKDDGIWINWPSFLTSSFNFDDFMVTVKRNEKRQEVLDAFRATFSDAKAYSEINNPSVINLRMEAMKPLFTGASNLYIRADFGKDIIEAINFGKEFGIKKVVIVGGDESYKVASVLKENQVPVILNQTHRLPGRVDEPVYQPYELPGLLYKAGVKVAVTYSEEWWRTRNLGFLAGTSSGFGNITSEEALQLITKNAAEIAGIDQEVGTLEKGKQASFLVSNGDILDMRGNLVEMVFIKGGKVNLDDKQKRLYEKYKDKYGKK